ncbi:MAG TPA: hypothetical protein DDZ89_03960 [Clostridiales bacterium]|nr:hypothetical protein [Clostridiales bacterium]
MIFLVIGIVLLEIFIDLYTKYKVKKHYEIFDKTGETGSVSPVLKRSWIRIRRPILNNGAFLGFLKRKPVLLNFLTGLSVLFILLSLIYFLIEKDSISIPLAIVLGGGLGNFIERVSKGSVTDFLHSKLIRKIVFNFADLFIFIGGIFMIISLFF